MGGLTQKDVEDVLRACPWIEYVYPDDDRYDAVALRILITADETKDTLVAYLKVVLDRTYIPTDFVTSAWVVQDEELFVYLAMK
jgi:hypothetical protein